MILRCSKLVFHIATGGFKSMGVPLNHQVWFRMFHEINHPAIEDPPWIGKTRSSQLSPVTLCTFSSCCDHCSFSSSSSWGARRSKHSSTGRVGPRSCSSHRPICEPWRNMMIVEQWWNFTGGCGWNTLKSSFGRLYPRCLGWIGRLTHESSRCYMLW
jgi:hypothetical protein